MDAARYFEEMHLAMSSQKPAYRLVLSVKVQDLGGADAYLELRQEPVSGKARVFYSTMGRQKLNFQLVRKGWQSCHNASGELTGRFPATADGLLAQTDFSAFVRDDALDSGRMARILDVLAPYCRWLWNGLPPLLPGRVRSSRWSGSWAVPPIGAIGAPAPQNS